MSNYLDYLANLDDVEILYEEHVELDNYDGFDSIEGANDTKIVACLVIVKS